MVKRIIVVLLVLVLTAASGWFYWDLRRLADRLNSYEALILSRTEQIDRQDKENSRLAGELSLVSDEFKKQMQALRAENESLKGRLQDMETKFSVLKDSTVMQVRDFSDITRGLENKTKDWMKESLATMNAIETELLAQRRDLEVLNVSRLPQLEALAQKSVQEADRLKSVQPEGLRTLYERMVRLEEQFAQIQEKVVDIILKH